MKLLFVILRGNDFVVDCIAQAKEAIVRIVNRASIHELVRVALLSSLAWSLPGNPLCADYDLPEITTVPVDRLARNLENKLKKNPQDSGVWLNLARLHGMAYALKTENVGVKKGHELEGVWFGHEPQNVPFAAKRTNDTKKQKRAQYHLQKAAEYHAKAIETDSDCLAARLGYAWCTEHMGDKKKAIELYRSVIERAWRKENGTKEPPLGWQPVTVEAAVYLKRLLDPELHKKEIAKLDRRIQVLVSIPRTITPVVIPLRAGVSRTELINRMAHVAFDADGTGKTKLWTWANPDVGWLVYDPGNSGEINSALQMFGNVSFWLFWKNGYSALSALDDNDDGILVGPELNGLAVWCDANSNGISEPGEVMPIEKLRVTSLSCQFKTGATKGVRAFSPHGITLQNGEVRNSYDILLENVGYQ